MLRMLLFFILILRLTPVDVEKDLQGTEKEEITPDPKADELLQTMFELGYSCEEYCQSTPIRRECESRWLALGFGTCDSSYTGKQFNILLRKESKRTFWDTFSLGNIVEFSLMAIANLFLVFILFLCFLVCVGVVRKFIRPNAVGNLDPEEDSRTTVDAQFSDLLDRDVVQKDASQEDKNLEIEDSA